MSGDRTFVTTRLVGRQLVDVNATHPKTDEARVSIKVGSTLLYARSADVLRHMADQWASLQPHAHRLPRTADPRLVEPFRGMGSAAAMAEFDEMPHCAARLVNGGAHKPFFLVQLGPIGYEARDLNSYITTMSGFMRARDMADRVFVDKFPTLGQQIGLELDIPLVAGA